jgi:hypothetical protein
MSLLTKSALEVYLNDHLAGSSAGLGIARRIASAEEGNEYGDVAGEIAGEIEGDKAALEDVMRRLGIGHDQIRLTVAWGAERARRVLRVAWLLDPGGEGLLEELELLMLGVTGKRALWRALSGTKASDPRLRGVQLETLEARADSQLARLEQLRLRAAAEAFA